MLVFFVVARVELICKVEYKKGGQDHIAQNEPHCQPPWQFLDRVFNGMPKNSFFTLIVLTTYFLILLFISVLICQTIHIFMPRVFLSLFQPLNSRQWSRQNFSLQYQYNIRQTSDENKEKYQLGDYWLIQYQILKILIIRIYSRQ